MIGTSRYNAKCKSLSSAERTMAMSDVLNRGLLIARASLDGQSFSETTNLRSHCDVCKLVSDDALTERCPFLLP